MTWTREEGEAYLKTALGRIPYTIWAEYDGPTILKVAQFLALTTFYHTQAAQGKLYDVVIRPKKDMPDPWGLMAYCIHASLRGGRLTPKFVESIGVNQWTFALFSIWDKEMETYAEHNVDRLRLWVSDLFTRFLQEDSWEGRLTPAQEAFRTLVLSSLRIIQVNKIGIVWDIPGINMERDKDVIRREFEGNVARTPRLGIAAPMRRRQLPPAPQILPPPPAPEPTRGCSREPTRGCPRCPA